MLSGPPRANWAAFPFSAAGSRSFGGGDCREPDSCRIGVQWLWVLVVDRCRRAPGINSFVTVDMADAFPATIQYENPSSYFAPDWYWFARFFGSSAQVRGS